MGRRLSLRSHYEDAINSDGSILLTGKIRLAPTVILARIKNDGTLDTSFGSGGYVAPALDPSGTECANAIVRQPDGKLVIAGYAAFSSGDNKYRCKVQRQRIARHLVQRRRVSIDLGYRYEEATALVLQTDGRIVLAGSVYLTSPSYDNHWGVARVDAAGNVDTTFSSDGIDVVDFGSIDDEAHDVLIQNDGKIVVVGCAYVVGSGTDRAFVRYNSDGSRDTSFGASGAQVLSPTPDVFEDEWAAAFALRWKTCHLLRLFNELPDRTLFNSDTICDGVRDSAGNR